MELTNLQALKILTDKDSMGTALYCEAAFTIRRLIEKSNNALYLCNRKKCKVCSTECLCTTDINYALTEK